MKRFGLIVSSYALGVVLLALLGCSGSAPTGTVPAVTSTATVAPRTSAEIAFTRDGDVWVARSDGSEASRLTSGTSVDFAPAWSPDRTHIAFVRTDEETFNETSTLCVVSSSGGSVRQWPSGSIISNPCYAPDGRSIAFVESVVLESGPDKDAHRERVVIFDLASQESTHPYELRDLFTAGMTVSWSPDGSRLLLGESMQDIEGQRTGVLDLRSRQLTWLPIPDAAESHWSPDGTTIVVSQGTQTRSAILLASPEGRITRVVVRGAGLDDDSGQAVGQASYSPDGSRLVYTKGSAVAVIRIDGTSARTIVPNAGAPVWSSR